MLFIVIALTSLIIILFLFGRITHKTPNLSGKHVLITGGSSGIGLEVAKQVARLGAKVTIYARNLQRLEEAKVSIFNTLKDSMQKDASIHIQSVDMSSSSENLKKNLEQSEKLNGPVYFLVNNAGFSRASAFENLEENIVKDMFEANIYGSFFLTQHVIKKMKSRGNEGFITFLSSQAGLFGFYGFSAYAACKGAIIRMAEALHMEVKPYGISVTVCLPPDTNTPGFSEEEKTKPVECKLISASAGIIEPDVVVKALFNDTFNKRFYSTVGLEGYMLRVLCGGMAPINSITDFLIQVFVVSLFKLVSGFYLIQFAAIVRNEYKKKIKYD